MKNVIFFIAIFSSLAVHSNTTENLIINQMIHKRTKESITAYCSQIEILKDKQKECQEIEIIYENKKKEKTTLVVFDGLSPTEIENSMDDVITNQEIENMQAEHYEAFGTYRKICELGGRGYLSDNKGCVGKLIFSMLLIPVAFATLPASSAAGAVALGGVAFSAAAEDLSLVQIPLLFPALVVDGLRALTVLPIKKLVARSRSRKFRKHAAPLLQELKFDLTSGEINEVDPESPFGPIKYIKPNSFKTILKVLTKLGGTT